jgi:hypothetical protein
VAIAGDDALPEKEDPEILSNFQRSFQDFRGASKATDP